jgi:hypothetical protein
MDCTRAPPKKCFLFLDYVFFCLNHTFSTSINNDPLNPFEGNTVNMSVILHFYFREKVYNKAFGKSTFTSEEVDDNVGISKHCGHALTWKILSNDTEVIFFCLIVHPFTSTYIIHCAELLDRKKLAESGSNMVPIIKFRADMTKVSTQNSAKSF